MTQSARRAASLGVLAVWAVMLALLLMRHEMWRDELQAWMLVRDSHSLGELWQASRYEGHPLLWHLLLYPLAHLFQSPAAMQVMHWAIATGATAMLVMAAPFPLWTRAALAFSYLPFFEYGVISRNYVLTVLGVWMTCALLGRPESRGGAVGGVAVASNASAMGILLAPALAVPLLAGRSGRRARAVTAAVVAVAVALAVWQCWPPADYEHARGWWMSWHTERAAFVLRGFAVALLPVPKLMLPFWGSSVLFPSWPFPAGSAPMVAVAAGAVVLATILGLAWAIRRSKAVLVGWLMGSAALLMFVYVKLPGAIRHHGFLFILLVAVLWLAVSERALTARRASMVLAPFVLAGVVGSAMACWWDWRKPFSGARCAAETLQRDHLDRLPLVGTMDFTTSGVAGYLPRGRLYYPAVSAEGSFIVWDLARTRQDRLSQEEIIAEGLARDRGEGVVLLADRPLPGLPGECSEVFACGPTIVADEAIRGYLCGARPQSPSWDSPSEVVSSRPPPEGVGERSR